ncbi:oxysterol-binding 4B-like protein [Rhynchospora pubera]|uniref:Oxysterol-binding 4B-like protein n=1 Tax=Rhynchospora pubera TaxID=906938 RepID=A0AAV8GIC2_9POAL|nr:oxysterol-binding 4B-like protein [Rhynchospora pubera]
MPPTSAENKSLHISKEDKFYSRLLTKESSVANPSFRVYYGGASGAVPFLWESQPGTPKNPIHNTMLPPLTPPPSYFSNLKSNNTPKRSISKPNLITTILPKISLKKSQSHSSISSTSSSSTSSTSSNSSSSPASVGPHCRRARLSSPRSSFSSKGDDYDSDDGSPTSTLCFGRRHGPAGRARAYSSVVVMKNALMAIVGHGSGD